MRQSLELYGSPGLERGEANTHLFYQPVIHVDDDRQGATARFRVFSMQGQYGLEARMAGGVFENRYVREDGVWKIASDHLYTTFIADL